MPFGDIEGLQERVVLDTTGKSYAEEVGDGDASGK